MRPAGLLATPGAAGVDEAGRGALAGPVVAAAVILPEGFDVTGLADSKILTPRQREEQELRIQASAWWAVAFAEPEEIDQLNILRATLACMARAVAALPQRPHLCLVDGNQVPDLGGLPVETVIKGDATHAAIAAASILAKTARDRRMRELALVHPGYGFEDHVGYGAPVHLAAIRSLGPCPIHRRSFEPIRSMVEQGSLFD